MVDSYGVINENSVRAAPHDATCLLDVPGPTTLSSDDNNVREWAKTIASTLFSCLTVTVESGC